MRRHRVQFAMLLAFLIAGSASHCFGEQILKKGSRKILGYRVENSNKFKSCRGKVLEVGDGQVVDTNIKCGCATCPPIFGNADRWKGIFKASLSPGKLWKQQVLPSQSRAMNLHHQAAGRAFVLLRNPPMKEVTLGYIGKRDGSKFRTCDGDVMEIKEFDRVEETEITCDTDIKKLPRKLLEDRSHYELEANATEGKYRQYLGIRISKRLFLTCDNSIFELKAESRLVDTDLDCDCDSCTDSPEKVKPKE